MKKILTLIILTIFLISFVLAIPITGSAAQDKGQKSSGQKICENAGGEWKLFNNGCVDSCELARQDPNDPIICTQAQTYGCDCGPDKCWNGASCENNQNKELTQSQIKNIIKNQNKLRINQSGECPENCTCAGSVIKCPLERGGREMTIQAGKSGNIIIQVKGIEAETKVELYKSDRKIYGQFKNNETKRVRMMPDQVKEKTKEKLKQKNEECNITLNENGNYQVQTQKRAKLFGLFKVMEKVRLEYDAGTGELVREQNSWWGFLAKDIIEEELLGTSCGTVSPDSRNECCQNKGYDLWDSEKGECVFVDTDTD